MLSIPFPRHLLDASLPHAEQRALDLEHYRRLGVVVLRGAIPADLVRQWVGAWEEFRGSVLAKGRKVDPFNPVVVHEPLSDALEAIHRHPVLVDLMARVYPDVGLYMHRFLLKDAQSRRPVFLHQDCCYDLGFLEKTAMFLPLAPMSPDNGGLRFYPGTHLLGYLGDAGELDRRVLAEDWPVIAPTLHLGDVVLMHECTWHESTPHVDGPDRVVTQITFQPASDPSGVELLRGQSAFGMPLGSLDRDRIFVRSRSSRLRELQAAMERQAEKPQAA